MTKRHFDISLTTDKANIIQIIPNSLVTRHIIEEVRTCEQGLFQPSTVADQLKLAVIERHHRTNQIGLGIVKGLGFTLVRLLQPSLMIPIILLLPVRMTMIWQLPRMLLKKCKAG